MPTVIRTPNSTISAELVPLDSILTRGSLLLVEPGHPARPWGSGMPEQNAVVPNIARTQFADLAGITPDAAADALVKNTITSTEGVVERTAKGGVNTVISQTTGTFPRMFGIAMRDALRAYLAANKSHRFYLSTWFKTTRPAAAGTAWRIAYIIPSSSAVTSSIAALSQNTDGSFGGSPSSSDSRRNGFATVTSGDRTFSAIAAEGTPTSGWTSVTAAFEQLVQYGGRLSGEERKSPSGVFYRVYLEDLSVSGRSFEQVRTRDYAAWVNAFGAAGRYVDDTIPTSPSTIP